MERTPEAIIDGKLWGIYDHDDHGSIIRITQRASLDDFPKSTEHIVFGQLGWDVRFPHLHTIEYDHVEYSIDYGSSVIYICCEVGPGEICPAVLDALGIYKYHDTTHRSAPKEFFRARYAEYRSLIGNAPFQWLAIVIQGNIETIPTGAFTCPSRPKTELSVAFVDMRDSLVKTIREGAFQSCPILQRVCFSHLTETIGNNVFFACEELGDCISIPRSLRFIGAQTFFARKPIALVVEDGVPAEERKTRRIVVRQQTQIGNVTHIWGTAYDIRGSSESIRGVNVEGQVPDEEEVRRSAQGSSTCLVL
jgi:hypothetical protein